MVNFVEFEYDGCKITIKKEDISIVMFDKHENGHYEVTIWSRYFHRDYWEINFGGSEEGRIEAQALYDKLRGKKEGFDSNKLDILEEGFNLCVEKLNQIRQHTNHLLGFNAGIFNETGKFRGIKYGGENLSKQTIAHDNIDIANDIYNIVNDKNSSFEDILKEIIKEKDDRTTGYENCPETPEPNESKEWYIEYPKGEPKEADHFYSDIPVDSDEELISILRDRLCDAQQKLDKIKVLLNILNSHKEDLVDFNGLELIPVSIINRIKSILEEKE